MPQSFAEHLGWVAKSRTLSDTVDRALIYAYQRGHAQVGLEHLLLALTEDLDAAVVLGACRVDTGRLRTDLGQMLARQTDPLARPGMQPAAGVELRTVFEYASAAAEQSRRAQIDGAIILAAIIGEGTTQTAELLRRHGLNFEDVIRSLQGRSPMPGPGAAPTAQQSAGPQVNGARPVPSATAAVQPPPAPPPPVHPAPIRTAPPQPAAPASPPPAAAPPPSPPPAQVRVVRPPATEPAPRGFAEEAPRAASGRAQPANDGKRSGGEPTMGDVLARAQTGARQGAQVAPSPAIARPSAPPTGGRSASPSMPAGVTTARPPQPVPPPAPRAPAPAQAPAAAREMTGRPPDGYLTQPGMAGRAAAGPAMADAMDGQSGRLKPALQGPPPDSQRPKPSVESGQLVENIPRRMRVATTETVEVRIARSKVDAIADGMRGAGIPVRHEIFVTRAMTVRLRAPDGGFTIETLSPETQWIEITLGLLHDDFATWRWTITPQKRGSGRLQLAVAARTVGGDGLVAETALPEQIIEVKVATNYLRSAQRLGGWSAAALAGALIGKWGDAGVTGVYQAAVRFFSLLGRGG